MQMNQHYFDIVVQLTAKRIVRIRAEMSNRPAALYDELSREYAKVTAESDRFRARVSRQAANGPMTGGRIPSRSIISSGDVQTVATFVPKGPQHDSPGQGDASLASVAAALGGR